MRRSRDIEKVVVILQFTRVVQGESTIRLRPLLDEQFWVLRRFLRVRNFRVADETVERRFRNFEHGSKSNFQNFNNLQTPKRSIQKTMKYNTVRGRGTRKQWRKVYFRFGVTNRWLRKGFGQAEAGEPTSAPVSAPF